MMYLPFVALFAVAFAVAAVARKLGFPERTRQQRLLYVAALATTLVVIATSG